MILNRTECLGVTVDNLELYIYTLERLHRIFTQLEIPGEFKGKSIPNLWLRGSVARGVPPFKDIDITHYGPDSEFNKEELPITFLSDGYTEFAYHHVRPEDFPRHFGVDLRYISSLNEMVPVTSTTEDIVRLIAQEKAKLSGPIMYYHVLYRIHEQGSVERAVAQGFWRGYKKLNEYPGSRRTIQRICWIIQSLYPNYRNIIIPEKLLYILMQEGFVPKEVVLASFGIAQTIMKASKDQPKELEMFLGYASTVHSWYEREFLPPVSQEISAHIDQDYLNLINLAKDPNTSQSDLKALLKITNQELQGFKQWLAMCVLAQNLSDPKMLYELWQICSGRREFNHIIKILLYNPYFPIERTKIKEVSHDGVLKNLREIAFTRNV